MLNSLIVLLFEKKLFIFLNLDIFYNQRYGWHGRDDTSLQENFDNAVGRYPWLEDVRDKSVTELEFLHGHLNNPGVLPAVICFRDKV